MRLADENAKLLGERHLRVIFRKGSRVKEEHVYDSDLLDDENQLAVLAVLYLLKIDSCGLAIFDFDMIGKGFAGPAPWETVDPDRLLTPAERFHFFTPLRVADVNLTQSSSVIVFIESV